MSSNIITQCIELFNLLPTTPLYKWSIAADWIQEEQNIEITANTIREGIFVLEVIETAYGSSGFGNSNNDGYSSGNGRGDGNGCGYEYVNARGNGHGNGCGFGFGEGDDG